jgi:hypothetical protein
VPSNLFVVLIYEDGDRDDYTKAQLDAIDSVEMREYMESHGYFLRVVDQNVVGGDGKPTKNIASFLIRAEGHRPDGTPEDDEPQNPHLPRIIIADQNAEILVDVIVTDEASTIDALKKHGGE